MKYYIPIHLDGGNRGCEAITKGTAQLLHCTQKEIVALCGDINLDHSLGLDKFVTLQARVNEPLANKLVRKAKSILNSSPGYRKHLYYHSIYAPFLKQISNNDIMLSTGGDMLCYGNNEVIYTNEELYKRNIKTVLWGCSIGKDNLTPEKIETLGHFTAVYARESLTQELLEGLGLKNVFLYPDPAFILQPEVCELPVEFENSNTIGLNVSNYVLGGFTLETSFGKEIKCLIDYILSSTNYKILLIPHVMWKGQDDRIICKLISDHYNNTRILTLDTSLLNYSQIRYVISQCRFFIGARTHAVISAYSTHVPTIALGYSIKSKGIANDLELGKALVVDSRNEEHECLLLQSFSYLVENEKAIKEHLIQKIPTYIKRLYDVRQCINNL
jgi:colanic acid/amylovoran biosynthesis protein